MRWFWRKRISTQTVSISSTNCKNLVGKHPSALHIFCSSERSLLIWSNHFFVRLLLLSSSIGLFTFILLQFLQTNSTTLIIIIFDLIFEMAFHLSPSKKALVLSETHSAAQEKGLLPLPPSRRLSRSRHSWADKQRIGTVVVASPAFVRTKPRVQGTKTGTKSLETNFIYTEHSTHLHLFLWSKMTEHKYQAIGIDIDSAIRGRSAFVDTSYGPIHVLVRILILRRPPHSIQNSITQIARLSGKDTYSFLRH